MTEAMGKGRDRIADSLRGATGMYKKDREGNAITPNSVNENNYRLAGAQLI